MEIFATFTDMGVEWRCISFWLTLETMPLPIPDRYGDKNAS